MEKERKKICGLSIAGGCMCDYDDKFYFLQ